MNPESIPDVSKSRIYSLKTRLPLIDSNLNFLTVTWKVFFLEHAFFSTYCFSRWEAFGTKVSEVIWVHGWIRLWWFLTLWIKSFRTDCFAEFCKSSVITGRINIWDKYAFSRSLSIPMRFSLGMDHKMFMRKPGFNGTSRSAFGERQIGSDSCIHYYTYK